MSFLPTKTYLGALEIVEVYEIFDKPVLFACRNSSGHLYLVVWEDEEEDVSDTWLYVGVSQYRLEEVRTGGIDLKTAFKEPEDTIVHEVIIPKEGKIVVNPLNANNLSDDRLPVEGEKLSFQPSESRRLVGDLKTKANSSRKEYLKMNLTFSNRDRHDAPAQTLGNILTALQETLYTIAMTISPLYEDSKHKTQSLIQEMELAVVDVGVGSFEIEMASTNQANMFGDSLLGDALEQLLDMVNSIGSENEDKLKAQLSVYKTNLTPKYVTFLTSISKSSIDKTYMEWASPRKAKGGSITVTAPRIIETVEYLQKWEEETSQTIEIVGKLTGMFLSTKRFEIETSDKNYRGKIVDGIGLEEWEFMSNATLSKRYKATIRETIREKVATDDIQTSYTLLLLENVDG